MAFKEIVVFFELTYCQVPQIGTLSLAFKILFFMNSFRQTNNIYKSHVLLTLFWRYILYFLKLCLIFVGPTLCQFTKYSNFLEAHIHLVKVKLILYPQVRKSMTQLTLIFIILQSKEENSIGTVDQGTLNIWTEHSNCLLHSRGGLKNPCSFTDTQYFLNFS